MKIGDLVKHKNHGNLGIIVGWVKRHPEWRTHPKVRWIGRPNQEEIECNKQRLEVIG